MHTSDEDKAPEQGGLVGQGGGLPDLENIKICCGFLQNVFCSSGRKLYSGQIWEYSPKKVYGRPITERLLHTFSLNQLHKMKTRCGVTNFDLSSGYFTY
jgi:hypothetical protein